MVKTVNAKELAELKKAQDELMEWLYPDRLSEEEREREREKYLKNRRNENEES